MYAGIADHVWTIYGTGRAARDTIRDQMSSDLRLVVHCKNYQCCYATPLPYSIPEGKNIFQAPIPKELFPLVVLCRKCKQWFGYFDDDVEWGAFPTLSRIEGIPYETSW